jgi:DNA-binding response OmpR family regulator
MTFRVLLVEDDPTMIMLLQTLLEIEGFEPVLIENYDNVLGEVHAAQPDVVLMDVHLREINGLEVLGAIRADAVLKQPCIIMASGMDFREQALTAGANDFLQKPFMPDELVRKIKAQMATGGGYGA